MTNWDKLAAVSAESFVSLLLKSLAVLILGTVLGLAATWAVAFRGDMPGGIADGPWRTNLAIGSAGADARTRAAVALHGLFALNRSETIYYTAMTDDAGDRLNGGCTYRVAGRDPGTRWWSVTAYGADDYLIANAANRYSVSKNSVARDAGGSFDAEISAAPRAGNWIPVAKAPFSLTLRLYNPGPRAAADPAHAELPKIEKVSCK
jgi:hypothetical protein